MYWCLQWWKSISTSLVLTVNPLMLTSRPKAAWQYSQNLSRKSIVRTIFDGETLIRRLTTTLLQIFCIILFNSKVIAKSILDPDDNFPGTIFDGETVIKRLPTTLLQIFCLILFNSKVIVRSILDADDNFQGELLSGLSMVGYQERGSGLRSELDT